MAAYAANCVAVGIVWLNGVLAGTFSAVAGITAAHCASVGSDALDDSVEKYCGPGVGVAVGGTGVGVGGKPPGVGVAVRGTGVGVGGSGVGVGGSGVGVALELLTMVETYAVPIGTVPPCWKTRTIRVCVPFATVVEFQAKFPLPESTLVPSTSNWSQ